MTAKMGGQGIDEDWEGWLVVEAAGLPGKKGTDLIFLFPIKTIPMRNVEK
ncbi:MAG: hypothetical protein KKC76_06615 [Proteobacteria bacterium]|nr:hypothetical protein [Pseudomonadota bacterium]MBU4295520.1 hypothetical protein [Pseudomonadota bacterium]MCG2749503.1 hypothetical protein [Desulfobulbaceae bacterium]